MPLADFSGDFPLLCQRLCQAKRHNRTGQAYLFVGDDTPFLEAFANGWSQTAACTGHSPDGDACGHCQPCALFAKGCYPECITIRPQSKSRTITVEAMRQFEHDLSLATTQGMLKIGIVVEAECLGEEAQNAFLKTLEEPPQNTMLLLLTVNARKLLPTIRSRCQVISLLRNRQSYKFAQSKGLFAVLANLRRNAGAGIGLRTTTDILRMFNELHHDAEEAAEALKDHRWDEAEDPKIKQQLADEHTARIEAEYVKLREAMLGALTAWFQQRFLIACGVKKEYLPHEEMLQDQEPLLATPPTPDEAAQDIRMAEELVAAIKANVDERLALDAFSLTLTEKKTRR